MITLRAAAAEDLPALSDLCLRSKAVWGYNAAFLDACRAELSLTRGDIAASHIAVAECGGALVGVAQVKVCGEASELAKLFVEPKNMGAGVGRGLYDWARAVARREGALGMTIDADPGAASFYRRMGAIDHDVAPSGSIPGRLLPRLTARLG